VGLSDNEAPAPASQKAIPLDLKAKVNGFVNGKVKLLGFYGDQNWVFDSTMADAQGNLRFKRDSAIYEGMYFLAFPDQKYAQVLIGHEQQITLEFSKDDPVNTMIVQGSLDTELLYQNLKFEADIQKKFDAIKKKMDASTKGSPEYLAAEQEQNNTINERKAHVRSFKEKYPYAFFTKFKIAGQNPELRNVTLPDGKPNDQLQVYYYRNDFWNDVDFSDVRLLRTPVYWNKLKRYMKELTPQVTDSLIKYADIVTEKSKADKEIFKFTANWIALNYKETKVMGLEAVYVHMVDKYWTRDQAWWSDSIEIAGLRREIGLMKPSLIGQTGQDLRAKNELGEYISMYDIKTPFIVLYIFSYECENCQEETPKLVKVMNDLKQKNVADLFTLGIEGTDEGWKAYIKKTGLSPNFHNVFDLKQESKYPRKYHVDVTPEIYVLDKNHKIIGSNLHAEQIRQLIEQAK
jgi:peroxiredoxin